MRLRQLDLIRYGRFADVTLDFGPSPDGPDVTVVYGQNEAGKSTAHTAWLDLLYGLPKGEHPHAFRFDRKELMVGAVIETPDHVLTLRRTGATKDPLTDDRGHAIEENRLQTLLWGLDRSAYRTRFSLNDQILRDGGAEIAAAQGDLGQLLHAGTSGLSGITAELDLIEKDIDDFHRKGRSVSVLARTKKELAEIEGRIADARLDPRLWDRLQADLATAEAEQDAARAARTAAQRDCALRQTADRCRELMHRTAVIDADLALLPDGPSLSPGAEARMAEAVTQRDAAREALATARQAAETAAADLSALPADPDGAAIVALFQTVMDAVFDDGQKLEARAQTAAADIDNLRDRADALGAQCAALAVQIGGAGATPDRVALPRDVLTRLLALAEAARDADRDRDNLTAQCSRMELLLGPDQPVPPAAADLAAVLAAAARRPDDMAQLLVQATAADAAATAAALGLGPDWSATVAAGLPEEAALTALASQQDRVQHAADAAARALADAVDRHAALQATDAAATTQDDIVTDAELAATFAAREAAWQLHRATLDAVTADAFAVVLRTSDDQRTRHAAMTEARLQLAQRRIALSDAAATVARRRADDAAATAALADGTAAIAQLARRLGLPADSPAGALRDRRAALLLAAQAAASAATARDALAAAQARQAALDARLRDVLTRLDVPAPQDDVLWTVATSVAADLDRRAEAARARTAATTTLTGLLRDRDAAAAAATAAQTAFAAAVAPMWCRDLTAEAFLALRTAQEDLTLRLQDRADLDRRIGRLALALDHFRDVTQPLVALLGLAAGTGPTAVVSAARLRAAAAQDLSQQRATLLASERDAAAAMARAAARIETCDAAVQQILTGQAVSDHDPRVAMATLLNRDTLRSARDTLLAERARIGQGHDPDALAREIADDDPLRGQHLSDRQAAADAAYEAAMSHMTKAQLMLDQALSRDGAAALQQERATVLDTLAEATRAQAAQMLGLLVARTALRRFRRDRRGAFLQAVEGAFTTMTGGAWSGLDTQPMGRTERLVGVRDGAQVAVDAMSTGTRGQLYLALRIAGHADFITRNGPLPFVTDDIHETFDDDRAQAAIRLAGEMGQRGQVILFTHHRHLVDLARAAIPDVRVIAIPPA